MPEYIYLRVDTIYMQHHLSKNFCTICSYVARLYVLQSKLNHTYSFLNLQNILIFAAKVFICVHTLLNTHSKYNLYICQFFTQSAILRLCLTHVLLLKLSLLVFLPFSHCKYLLVIIFCDSGKFCCLLSTIYFLLFLVLATLFPSLICSTSAVCSGLGCA